VFAALMHFVIPRAYQRIVPPYLPAPKTLVYVGGLAEIAGGAGLMLKTARRMVVDRDTDRGVSGQRAHGVSPPGVLPDSLPRAAGAAAVQGVFIAWVRRATQIS
jgi:hypothetical protein